MKLIRAHIKNFRLLRNIKFDFSVDPKKPLTVIRAANMSGKTTALIALKWGLFGSASLPGKGKNWVLFPQISPKKKVEVSVEIEFETEQVISIGPGKQAYQPVQYTLQRKCIEYQTDGKTAHRESESVTLFKRTPTGTQQEPDSNVKNVIESCIPESLIDVYFTDGDRAMSFTEAATEGAKRKRVQNAIEALLGLDTLEKTIKDLDKTAKHFQGKIDNTDYAKQLEQITDRIDGYNDDIEEWAARLEQFETEITKGDKRLLELSSKIDERLKLGNKEELVKERNDYSNRILKNKKSADQALNTISQIMRSKDLAASMIALKAKEGLNILNAMNKEKQLPKVNIPILEELLSRSSCFCGSDLSEKTDDGSNRRKRIAEAIENSRESDALQESATSLFYAVRSVPFDIQHFSNWKERYNSLYEAYFDRIKDTFTFETKLKEIEVVISGLDDDLLSRLKEEKEIVSKKTNNARVQAGGLNSQLKNARSWHADLQIDRTKVESKMGRDDANGNKLKLSRLVKEVFSQVYDYLRNDELKNVSNEMNRIFLSMIGATGDSSSNNDSTDSLKSITSAVLTKNFDIMVYGANNHFLNPDQDLNGASRRAITLAFILALAKVSKVIAPNIIDTPVGMMSGGVKKAVISKTIEEGTQTILFLTHSEIMGIEDILDAKAGESYTMTNPEGYPGILANETEVELPGAIRCECNHRTHCKICEINN